MRGDLVLLAAAAGLALAAGVLYLRGGAQPVRNRWAWGRAVLAYGAGVCALAALGWQAVAVGAWPGGGPAGALGLLAAGALGLFPWLRGRTPPRACGLGLLGVGLTLLAALAVTAAGASLGESAAAAAPAVQANAWPFGVRAALAGIGLGGWLWALAGSLPARLRRTHAPDVRASGDAGTAAAAPVDAPVSAPAAPAPESAGAAAAAGASVTEGAMVNESAAVIDAPAQPAAQVADEAERGVNDDHAAAGRAALRLAFPWLTLALLAAAAWNLLAYAVAWRGAAADLWLLIAWLIGAAYLHGSAGYRGARLGRGARATLAGAGLVAAVMAAVQAASLF